MSVIMIAEIAGADATFIDAMRAAGVVDALAKYPGSSVTQVARRTAGIASSRYGSHAPLTRTGSRRSSFPTCRPAHPHPPSSTSISWLRCRGARTWRSRSSKPPEVASWPDEYSPATGLGRTADGGRAAGKCRQDGPNTLRSDSASGFTAESDWTHLPPPSAAAAAELEGGYRSSA